MPVVSATSPPLFLFAAFLTYPDSGAFLMGAPMTIASISLPQRYQLVNELSPLDAGVKFLAYGVPFPYGVVVSSVLAGRFRVPFIYIIGLGTALQIIGFALLSTTPNTVDTWGGQFGYSFIAGLGVGITGGLYTFLNPLSINKKEQCRFPVPIR